MKIFNYLLPLSLFLPFSCEPSYASQKHEKQTVKRQKVLSFLCAKPKHNFPEKPFSFANENAPKGGTLKLSNQGTFDNLNRFSIKGASPTEILPLLYDSLMYRSPDEPFTMYPLLAKEVAVADDCSSVTFYLDERAKFSDGSSVTAEDVAFTIETLRKNIPRYKSAYQKIKSVECLDNLSIKITFNPKEDGTYDQESSLVMALLVVMPKKALEKIDITESSLTPVIGSGPYQIETYEIGRYIQAKRRDDYWAKDIYKGFYNFDHIRIDYYKNAQSQFQAFQTGAFDIYFETNPQNWKRNYHFDAVKTGKVEQIDEVHKKGVLSRYFILNMRNPLFQDRELRHAITLAYDDVSVNNLIFEGGMQIPRSTFANTKFAHTGDAKGKELELLSKFKEEIGNRFDEIVCHAFLDDKQKDHRKNIEEADKILKNAGYLVKNGVRLTKDTHIPLVISIMIKDEKLEKIALNYAQSLKKLGIELKILKVDSVQYENKVLESDFEMIIHALANSLNPGIEQTYYYSIRTADEKGSSNYIGLKDEVLEKLAKLIVASKTQEDHMASCQAMDRYLMHTYCLIPIMYDNKYRAAYWVDRFNTPPYNADSGTNVIAFGWKKS
ncbi:MAG: ABC transporter substrate-binding protein [Proteobacteria bacterium]|nr:ABC transporter substrate-binding protein [Pseudomonadota bacterium]